MKFPFKKGDIIFFVSRGEEPMSWNTSHLGLSLVLTNLFETSLDCMICDGPEFSTLVYNFDDKEVMRHRTLCLGCFRSLN